jgi:hypothetical protein
MYETYDGGEKLAEEVRGKTQDLYKEAALSMGGSASRFDKATEIFAASTKALDASINRLRGPGGTINSGGTGAYGANDSNTGRLAQPNIPHRCRSLMPLHSSSSSHPALVQTTRYEWQRRLVTTPVRRRTQFATPKPE